MNTDPFTNPTGSLGTWLGLDRRERFNWWQERWQEAIALSDRYRLALRCGWWQDPVAVEALAAFAAWVAAYDTEVADDPPGKLQLLAQLEWLKGLLRGGERAFDPTADRPAFDRHLASIGCRPPDEHPIPDPSADPEAERDRRRLAAELEALQTRLVELKQREQALYAQLKDEPASSGDHARNDIAVLQATIGQLQQRQHQLDRQLHHTAQEA